MSNKPVTDHSLHDASDYRCANHQKAKRLKGIKADRDRTCPACFIERLTPVAA